MNSIERAVASQPLTVEQLYEMCEQLSKFPVCRIVVSGLVPVHTCMEIPEYYDKALHRTVRVVVLGTETWKRFRSETVVADRGGPILEHGIRVEFSHTKETL